MPRVIAGNLKGLILQAPPGEGTRPTADRTKEAVFSSLGSRTEGAQVLDLCAGSGQLAIEALSRGAARAVLVEQDRKVCRLIAANLTKARLSGRAEVLGQDLRAALHKLTKEGAGFDLVFFDPPYAQAARLLPQVDRALAGGLLLPGGMLVLEEASRGFKAHENLHLRLKKSARYGAAMISYFVRAEDAEPASGDALDDVVLNL